MYGKSLSCRKDRRMYKETPSKAMACIVDGSKHCLAYNARKGRVGKKRNEIYVYYYLGSVIIIV
jgi:hypothetical protein